MDYIVIGMGLISLLVVSITTLFMLGISYAAAMLNPEKRHKPVRELAIFAAKHNWQTEKQLFGLPRVTGKFKNKRVSLESSYDPEFVKQTPLDLNKPLANFRYSKPVEDMDYVLMQIKFQKPQNVKETYVYPKTRSKTLSVGNKRFDKQYSVKAEYGLPGKLLDGGVKQLLSVMNPKKNFQFFINPDGVTFAFAAYADEFSANLLDKALEVCIRIVENAEP